MAPLLVAVARTSRPDRPPMPSPIIAVEWVASVGYGNEPAAVVHPGGN